MANSLKSYVEKFLLNPAASFHTDEDGNKETKAQVVETVSGEEGASTSCLSVSKLRARNAALQSEKDPRYRGKKVSRKEISQSDGSGIDLELQKYFMIEGEDEEESNDDNYKEDNDTDSNEEDMEEEDDLKDESSEEEGIHIKDKFNISEDSKLDSSHDLIYEGDFNQFAEDFESGEEESGDETEGSEESDNVEEEEDKVQTDNIKETGSMKTFSSQDNSQEIKKGQCVRNQLSIYDSMFESRIIMQKVLAGMNQLPQSSTYKYFIKENDENYNKNIVSARSSAKKLLGSLLDLQELLSNQNSETKHILSGGKPKQSGTESNEEITSSEDEGIGVSDGSPNIGKKRKLKVGEYEEILAKRHKEFIPYRDDTVNKWYERTKLLSNNKGGNKFGGFEVSALQQFYNLLSNKQQLIKRTQLTGATRGTTYRVLGKMETNSEQNVGEEYDPEIFDDSDFYTRALEEVLKAKVALSDDMNDVSRKWIEIQNLRRKSKKKVDTKASKGRKIRYEVHSKLQQYLAPCKPPTMDDSAINIIFSSLFGKALQSQQGTNSTVQENVEL